MKETNAVKRETWMDVLRIIATFAVIVIHVTAHRFYDVGVTGHTWCAIAVWQSLVRFAVPVFVMISGALFLDPSREVTLGTLFRKNILRLVTAYVFWSAIYALYTYESPMQFVKSFIAGATHMWFLPMIACLYLIVPFLRRITEDRKLTEYFLILSLIFTFVLPFILNFPVLAEIKEKYETTLNFFFTLGFVPYFVLGRYLFKKELTKKNRIFIYLAGVAGFLATFFGTLLLSSNNGEASSVMLSNFSPAILLQASAVFTFAKYAFNPKKEIPKFSAIASYLSKLTFGVYLSHVLVLDVVEKTTNLSASSFTPVLTVPLLTVITFIISLAITIVISFIPVLKKYII